MSSVKAIEEGGGGLAVAGSKKKIQKQKRNKENKPGPAQVITCRQVFFFSGQKKWANGEGKKIVPLYKDQGRLTAGYTSNES